MDDMKDPYPLHRGYEEVLGARDGRIALRHEIARDVPARAGPWDYCMIAAGSVAALCYRVSEVPSAVVGFVAGLLLH